MIYVARKMVADKEDEIIGVFDTKKKAIKLSNKIMDMEGSLNENKKEIELKYGLGLYVVITKHKLNH